MVQFFLTNKKFQHYNFSKTWSATTGSMPSPVRSQSHSTASPSSVSSLRAKSRWVWRQSWILWTPATNPVSLSYTTTLPFISFPYTQLPLQAPFLMNIPVNESMYFSAKFSPFPNFEVHFPPFLIVSSFPAILQVISIFVLICNFFLFAFCEIFILSWEFLIPDHINLTMSWIFL